MELKEMIEELKKTNDIEGLTELHEEANNAKDKEEIMDAIAQTIERTNDLLK